MNLNSEQANAITSAVWLVGLGILLTTGFWWPGILFLIGAGAIAQGFVNGRGWASLQLGVWTIGLGFVFLSRFFLLGLFVVIAVSGLLNAFVKPPGFSTKPPADPSLRDDL